MKNATSSTPDKPLENGLMLLALGIVFGDIGTSPLYAYQTAVALAGVNSAIGVASLVIWTLFLVVSFKYVFLIMRADYHGEGGVFALMALFFGGKPKPGTGRGFIACLLVLGAALLFGDGAITPAISVLSAVEGVGTINPEWSHLSVPISIAILLGLFLSQKFGTGKLGGIFGPVMLLWFISLAALGIYQIALHPAALAAFNPWYGVQTLMAGGWNILPIVGAVVLAVTGAEALYADLGHFGRKPIVKAWGVIVFPSLILNYIGQAAYVLQEPAAASNSNLFFLLLPNQHLRVAMVLLATVATVIASQALISGVFSLANQAIELGYLPRVYIRHTSETERGQIYIPLVNAILAILCILLVVNFRSSDALAGAYGIAVTGAMAITSFAFVVMARKCWGLNRVKSFLLLLLLLMIDLSLFAACLTKLFDGGLVPLVLAVLVAMLMLIWRKGRDLVHSSMARDDLSLNELADKMGAEKFLRIGGTLTLVMRQSTPALASARIIEHYRRIHALPEKIIILLLEAEWKCPLAKIGDIRVEKFPEGLWLVHATHGYMVEPDAPLILARAAAQVGAGFDANESFYVVGQEFIRTCDRKQMPPWQRAVFSFMGRNILPSPDYLNIPADRLIVYNWMLHLA
jgi:KUP system potassium uptake protein